MLILSGRSAISLGDIDSASANGDLHLASLLQDTDIPSHAPVELACFIIQLSAVCISSGEQRLDSPIKLSQNVLLHGKFKTYL